jgi:hypothetical protein
VDTGPREEDEPVTAHDDAPVTPDEATAEVMSLLSEGVPLALLADLANPHGPSSPDILQAEGLPDVAWWGEGSEPPPAEAATDELDDAADGSLDDLQDADEDPADGAHPVR